VGGKTSSDRDVNNLLEKTAPHLRFTSKEEAMGRAGLERLGVPVGGKFICLIGRDSTYLETIVNPGGNFDYHNFRDVDINSFILAADALADMGYYVLRMGTAVKARIESTNPKVIDYATSNLRSDFLDIYLGANCFFCISVSTGFDAIPTIFRRPVCYVNMLPIGYLSTFLKDSIAICKRHWLKKEARWLSLREVCELGLAFSLNSKDYLNQNVDVIENTPEEIRELVLEMVARLNGNWKSTPEDDQLQSHFWENYPVYAVSEYNNRRLHGKLNLRYGSDFLRNNSIWLN
jgi:putative glycosyltransferase (TIGR04372 family)